MSKTIVICSAKRTPMCAMQGCLSTVKASELGGVAIKAALEQAGCKHEDIYEVLMGCVLPAGMGQAPARQAALFADLPKSIGATTINKMCGSGLKTVMLAHDFIQAGTANLMVAGGLESMSQAPYILTKARGGYRLGHGELKDHMFLDGLEDAYEPGKLMGWFAEETAKKFEFTREQQDEFAIESLNRAKKASDDGLFQDEIVAVSTRKETIDKDETPYKAKIEKIPTLRPAFQENGTVTAANSSSISDGAAAIIVASEEYAKKNNLPIIAKIVSHATHAQEPAWFTTAPVGAMKSLFKKTGWSESDVDLFEVNEAFAVVTMAAMKELNLSHEKVNIHGGACALGHPVGASGTRILVTLLHALKRNNLKRGVASLCIGGGEATAIAVEIV